MKIPALTVILFLGLISTFGQVKPDSNVTQKLKADNSLADSFGAVVPPQKKSYQAILNKLLAANKYINVKQAPLFLVNTKRQVQGKEYTFYLLSIIILLFGFFKVFYARYFNNIFRVFFNTSLRQNQLTDLLLQARLPSLIFNVFFTLTGGLYVWLLIPHYYPVAKNYNTNILLLCIVSLGLIYITRFLVLKFIGWITGMREALNTYIFVIFLINKIIGIVLIPFVLIIAFAPPLFFESTLILTVLAISIFFLIRFFRSYSLLQHQIKISRFHFLLYILSLEILPLMLVYKMCLQLFLKI